MDSAIQLAQHGEKKICYTVTVLQYFSNTVLEYFCNTFKNFLIFPNLFNELEHYVITVFYAVTPVFVIVI